MLNWNCCKLNHHTLLPCLSYHHLVSPLWPSFRSLSASKRQLSCLAVRCVCVTKSTICRVRLWEVQRCCPTRSLQTLRWAPFCSLQLSYHCFCFLLGVGAAEDSPFLLTRYSRGGAECRKFHARSAPVRHCRYAHRSQYSSCRQMTCLNKTVDPILGLTGHLSDCWL